METDGLASVRADNPVGIVGGCSAGDSGAADRLLDRVLALALEVSSRSSGRPTHRSTPNCARLLCPSRTRLTQPARTQLASADRAHAGIYFWRTRNWIYNLQPALCRPALRRVIRPRRSKADGRVVHAGRF